MTSAVAQYTPPVPIRSHLLKNPSETVPPTEDLEALHAELKVLRERTLERAKKAGDDIRTIEESMRRMKEKEKGKAKALEKVKKERGFTPLPNGEEKRHAAQKQNAHKPRMPSVPVGSSASTPSYDSRRQTAEDLKKKKKKRKRDDFSDTEQEPQKSRKMSPLPPHTHPHPPAKAAKYPGSSAHSKNQVPAPSDFTLPQPASFLPVRPVPAPPPIPGPSKPTEVTEDFSKIKPPAQTTVSTFYSSIEPWLRPIKEEDIGWMEYSGDEVEPYTIPKLGPHYVELWENDDMGTFGAILPSTQIVRNNLPTQPVPGPLPKWEPSTLTEDDCMTEEHGHGPLNERLISALIPVQNEWKGVKAAEEAMEGRPGTNGAAAQAARDKLNVADLEERIKNVMRFYGLLDENPDFTEAVDDPIATALRHAQRELRSVHAANKARRTRIVAIAKDRLAYQEYVEARDCLDKMISGLYTKLQKKDGPKLNKKKKKAAEPNGSANGSTNGNGLPPPCPAALGLGPDEANCLVVPEQLKHYVDTRRQFVDYVGGRFAEIESAQPGRVYGVPKTNIFEGIEEDIQRNLERVASPPPQAGSSIFSEAKTVSSDPRTQKGKGKARGDAMDLG